MPLSACNSPIFTTFAANKKKTEKMQAIILAAGMGRRLGELTRNQTKCMMEVGGIRLIDRMLTQLTALDLRRVVIVVGYQAEGLRRHIGNRYPSLNIEYVVNEVYDRTNNIYSLALARQQLLEDDTLLIESDLILDDRLFPLLMDNPWPNLALVAEYRSWMDGTMVRLDQDLCITSFVPKSSFRYEERNQYYKTVNVYKFSRDFLRTKYVPFLEVYMHTVGENEYYEQVLRILTFLDRTELKALPIVDLHWYEIDDIQDLDIAETLFAEGEDLWRSYSRRFGGFWRFPGMLDFNYLVNPYFPSERLKQELMASFDDLLTQYPSGMGVNSLLAGKFFGLAPDLMVPGNGAAELIKVVMEQTPGRLGVAYPTFEEYPNRKAEEDLVIFHPENADFSYTADDLMTFFADKELSLLLLINPDNPSGNYLSRADVLRLLAWCEQRGVRLLVDESFVDFADCYPEGTLLSDELLRAHPSLIVMKSISKSYGVPGVRLGVLATADSAMIRSIRSEVSIWNINSFGEYFMQIYGKYEADYQRACRLFQEERQRLADELRKISFLRVIPSQANYFLCEVTSRYTSAELAILLIKRDNILIKDCGYKKAFAGKNYVRIAVRNTADNDRLLRVLRSLDE